MVLSTPSFSQILKGYLIIVTKGDYFINSVCVWMTSQNYWQPCWSTDVIKMATETTELEPLMLSNYSENLEGKVKYILS